MSSTIPDWNSYFMGMLEPIARRSKDPNTWIEHGDRNAIYAAARVGTPLEGCTMYLPGLPCMDCGRAIIQVGIVEVVYDQAWQTEWEKTTPRYVPDFLRVRTLLEEGWVKLTPFFFD